MGIKEGEKQTSMHASEKEKLQRMKTARRRRQERTREEKRQDPAKEHRGLGSEQSHFLCGKREA